MKRKISVALAASLALSSLISMPVMAEYTSGGNEITIQAASAKKMYDGTALTNDDYTITGGNLVEGDELSVTVEGSITDFGSANNVVTGYTIMRGEEDVTEQYTIKAKDGTLEVTKRDVTIKSSSAEKQYDGKPLTSNQFTIDGSGFVEGESVDLTFIRSQTFVGSNPNIFTYEGKGGYKSDNYDITKEFGNLTVIKNSNPIVITADSDSKMYDGTPLTKSWYDVTGDLAYGDSITIKVEGSITDVGSAANKVTAYGINHDNGDGTSTDVTEYYSGIQTVDGTLTVTAIPITVKSASDQKVYDGTPLTNNTASVISGSFLAGELKGYVVTGSQTVAGSSDNVFSIEFNNESYGSHYNITKEYGELTVEKSEVTVESGSATKVYDGTPLTCSSVSTKSGSFVSGEVTGITAIGSQTDAGSSENDIQINYAKAEYEDNYKVTKNKGTLNVDKADLNSSMLTIDCPSGTITFDRKPHGATATLNDPYKLGGEAELQVVYVDENSKESTTPPANPGKYTVKAVVPETAVNFNQGSVDIGTFEIVNGETGWKYVEGKVYYYKDGETLKGWQTIDDKRYWFDKDTGAMHADEWYTTEYGNKYYVDEYGEMATGWKTIGTNRYWFTNEGRMQKSAWYTTEYGNKYYVGKDGKMVTGWQTIDGKRYWFDVECGRMNKSKWYTTEYGNKYYVGSDGVMVTGWQTIDNDRYWFDTECGRMNKSKWYTTEYGNKYYVGEDGKMVKNWQTIDGKRYWFDADCGRMNKNKWYTTEHGNKYYVGSDGVMVTGWQTIGTDRYWFTSEGRMNTSKWYTTEYGNKYYVLKSGKAAKSGTWKLTMEDGTVKTCKFDSNGRLLSAV